MPTTIDRAQLLGCRIDRVDLDEAVRLCERRIETGTFTRQVSVNAAKLVALREDDELRRAVVTSEMINADGQAVVWASRLLGDALPKRVAGIDLMDRLLELSERNGYSVYILGAREDVLTEAIARLRQRHPGLKLAGWQHGYFRDDESGEVCAAIREARPDILFLAMSSPQKECWAATYGSSLGVPFVMGVGGAIDILAGKTRRAPLLLQRAGLEWLFRLLQEPRRLLGRYARTNFRFVHLVLAERFGRG